MTLIGFLMFLAPVALPLLVRVDSSGPTDVHALAMVAAVWVSGAGFSVMLHSLLLSP